jgi:hypothetical protein
MSAPEVLQQLVTLDVEKYRKLLQNDKPLIIVTCGRGMRRRIMYL